MIGKRFKIARLDAKFSLQRIADIMRVTPQAVAQWEKTNPNFDYAKVKTLATILQVTFEWLEGQRGSDDQIEYVTDFEQHTDRVPILSSKIEIISSVFLGANQGDYLNDAPGTVVTSYPTNGRGFAFFMDDDSLSPDIIIGDMLIFDSGLKPVEGDIVCSAEFFKDNGMMKIGIRRCTYIDNKQSDVEEFIKFSHHTKAYRGYTTSADAVGMIFAVMVEQRRFRRGASTP